MTALGLSSGALGNIRTQTLRAFTQADMKTIPWQDGLGLDGETGTTCRSRSRQNSVWSCHWSLDRPRRLPSMYRRLCSPAPARWSAPRRRQEEA